MLTGAYLHKLCGLSANSRPPDWISRGLCVDRRPPTIPRVTSDRTGYRPFMRLSPAPQGKQNPAPVHVPFRGRALTVCAPASPRPRPAGMLHTTPRPASDPARSRHFPRSCQKPAIPAPRRSGGAPRPRTSRRGAAGRKTRQRSVRPVFPR